MHILALPYSRLATSDSSPRHGGGGSWEAGGVVFFSFLAVADLFVLTAYEFCNAHGVEMQPFLEVYLSR